MIILPFIERELRVRSRSPGTYWLRFAIALAGVLVAFPFFMWSRAPGGPVSLGQGLLAGVVGAGFVVSCAACLISADVISSERREGTLGLLLLTRVGVFDVLWAKLASVGLTSLCALVAFLPLLMIPVLAGGVTGGEVIRKGLVLPNTLFLALAVGLWASARARDWSHTARTALLLLATVVFGPGLLELTTGAIWASGPTIGLMSPLSTILHAGDASYKAAPAQYWSSLFLVQAAGWALLVSAALRVRGLWQQDRSEVSAATVDVPESTKLDSLPRKPLGDGANPIAWLLQRQRGTLAVFWVGALMTCAFEVVSATGFRVLPPSSVRALIWPLSLAIEILQGALFAWAASRYLLVARQTGEFELLVTTPFGASQLVSTQWKVLRRMLLWPMLVMLAPLALRVVLVIIFTRTRSSMGPYFSMPFMLGCLADGMSILLQAGALCWVGLWLGFRAGSQARAIAGTVTLVKGIPYLFGILFWIFYSVATPLLGRSWLLPYWEMTVVSHLLALVFYVGLIRFARHRLGSLTSEPGPFNPRQSVSSLAREAASAWRKARHWTPPSP